MEIYVARGQERTRLHAGPCRLRPQPIEGRDVNDGDRDRQGWGTEVRSGGSCLASAEQRGECRRRDPCRPTDRNSLVRIFTSKLFVSVDSFAYLAFTQNDWDVASEACPTGGIVDPKNVNFNRTDRIILWQIHPDGSYRATVVEESNNSNPLLTPVEVPSPTGAIIPDGMGGVLLAVRRPHNSPDDKVPPVPAEFIYRIDGEGRVVYRSLLPSRDGELHDGMVLGENNIGFATRGALLIAFHVEDGTEVWRWDSGIAGIEVFAALADGSCLVQTPKALVDVFSGADAREVFEGKAMMDWRGQLYRQTK